MVTTAANGGLDGSPFFQGGIHGRLARDLPERFGLVLLDGAKGLIKLPPRFL